MKWLSSWWGIEILAEDEDDERVLKSLVELLPLQADSSYDDGVLEIGDKTRNEFVKYEGLTLTFHR